MNDPDELIALLCARVGMILEDASARALMVQALKPQEQPNVVQEIEREAERSLTLLSAARALLS